MIDCALPITVVVPTYNQRNVLELCLEGLLNQTLDAEKYELIVVDDASADDSAELLKRFARHYPNFRCVRHKKNLGRASARNTGIQLARGQSVVFVDGDLVTSSNYLTSHLQRHERAGAERLAVLGNVRYAPARIRNSCFAAFVNSRYLGMRTGRERERIDLNNLSPIHCGGGIVSVKRSDLLSIGGFDSSIRSYGGEDVDLGFRLHRDGVRFVFAEEAELTHHDTVSIQQAKAKAIELGRDSIPIIMDKFPEILEASSYRYLLPVESSRDSVFVQIGKRTVQFVLRPAFVRTFEWVILRTDRWCGCSLIYKFMLAGWTRAGIELSQLGRIRRG